MNSRLFDRYIRARHDFSQHVFQTFQIRDLTVVDILDGFYLVTAVDSDGAVGPKEHDVVHVGGYECGRFGTRVPLMEILACGAIPIAAFDQLSVEMFPTGQEIIRGVRDELTSVGLPNDFPLSGSTEDNLPTVQTGMGVVIVGIVAKSDFRPGSSKSGDNIYCIGIPKSGPDDIIRLDDSEIADAKTVTSVCRSIPVHDVLPVGSKGISYEADQLGTTAHRTVTMKDDCPLSLEKSGGPTTCFLISIAGAQTEILKDLAKKPVFHVGTVD
jgi:hypothetical protein